MQKKNVNTKNGTYGKNHYMETMMLSCFSSKMTEY